jgi:hypothetical protein
VLDTRFFCRESTAFKAVAVEQAGAVPNNAAAATKQRYVCKCCLYDQLENVQDKLINSLLFASFVDIPLVTLQACMSEVKVADYSLPYNNTNIESHLNNVHKCYDPTNIPIDPQTQQRMQTRNTEFTQGFQKYDTLKVNINTAAAALQMKNFCSGVTVVTNQEVVLEFIAEECEPYAIVGKPKFKMMMSRMNPPVSMTRQTCRNLLKDHCAVQEIKALRERSHRFAYLAIDSGTVWNRYVAYVLHVAGYPSILLELLPDSKFGMVDLEPVADEDEGIELDQNELVPSRPGELCIENLAVELRRIISGLQKYNIDVVGITTDNAKNVVGMAESVEKFPIRCGCHCLQLMLKTLFTKECCVKKAKDHTDKWIKTLREEEKAAKRSPIFIPNPCTTRWNSQLRTIEAVAKIYTNGAKDSNGNQIPLPNISHTAFAEVKTAIDVLKKFEHATKLVEGDQSNQVHMISAIAEMTFLFPGRGIDAALQPELQVPFYQDLVSAALTITAFFSPVFGDPESDHNEKVDDMKLLNDVILLMKRWFSMPVVALICHGYSRNAKELLEEFDGFCTDSRVFLPPSQQSWWENLNTLQNRWKLLGQVVRTIAFATSSEASAERCFSLLKNEVPPNRKRLTPENTSVVTRLAIYCKIRDAKDKNEQLKLVRNESQQTTVDGAARRQRDEVMMTPIGGGGAAAAASSASPVPPPSPALLIVQETPEQIRQHQNDWKSAVKLILATARSKTQQARTNRVEQARNLERYCNHCKKFLTNHAGHTNENVITCAVCQLKFNQFCVNVAVVSETWQCAACAANPRPPWY